MSCNRIQKLLFSEYSDFEDMVLVESPFAETTRDGRGIRQVQIGLTPTKLILATDVIKNVSEYPVAFFPGCLDAEIESLELISIFPIELVTLSVFRRRRRKVLKAKFHDGNLSSKILYFELGGFDKRKMFWNLWCERIKFLNPEGNGGSSLTETSVASSTSASSLYVTRTRMSNDKIWQYYSNVPNKEISQEKNAKWADKDLFFGSKMEKISYQMTPISYAAMIENDNDELRTLYRRQKFHHSRSSVSSDPPSKGHVLRSKRKHHVNRFGEGIDEKCQAGLYLPPISCSRCSLIAQTESHRFKPKMSLKEMQKLCEEGVRTWEASLKNGKNNKHPRRYGLTTDPHLFFCFGLQYVARGESYSIQVKRAVSAISIQEDAVKEIEFDPPSKRIQLCCSCSHESVRPWGTHYTKEPPVCFWTTDAWNRPNPLKFYRKNRRLLEKLKFRLNQRSSASCEVSKNTKIFNFGRKLFKRNKLATVQRNVSSSDSNAKFKMEKTVRAWDVDSTTLAFQITMIDARLFLKIPPAELKIVVRHGNGKMASGLMSWLVFSHRVSCLVATEILRTDNVKLRARLISRFINACEKCHLLQNYQSCRSLLSGLQLPAIFRLRQTWAVVRQSHATKYQIFEKLCRLYRDPRMMSYQKSFFRSLQASPWLPSALHILTVLLGNVFLQNISCWSSSTFSFVENTDEMRKESVMEQCKAGHSKSLPKMVRQIFSALKIYTSEKSLKCAEADGSSSSADSQFVQFGYQKQEDFIRKAPNSNLKLNGSTNCRHFGDAEELLRSGQTAARKYDLGQNEMARDFLLKVSYWEPETSFFASIRLEPD